MRRRSKKYLRAQGKLGLLIILVIYLLVTFFQDDIEKFLLKIIPPTKSYSIEEIPEYTGDTYVYIDNNTPQFGDISNQTESFELYSKLDILGRAGVAYANLSIDLMPTDARENISNVKPSGWHSIEYNIIPGKSLYNRCHLIAFQLAGENANEKNLITCTSNTNQVVMKEFEDKVAKYIKDTKNHVLYRVTPIYEENNLVASGIQMEALSVEDNGRGIKFNVYIYNVQSGIEIDYKTGESKLLQ